MTGEYVLRGARVLDRGGGFSGPLDVHVVDGCIKTVDANINAPGAADVDFAELLLLPGIFDVHDHLGSSTYSMEEALSTPLTQWTLETAFNARRTLEAGVTFVRDLAGADSGLRDGIARGFASGPRLQVSINMLCQTGGHGDGFLGGIGLEVTEWYITPEFRGRPAAVVDGVEEMRHAVRGLIRAGADWIKLATTGPQRVDFEGDPDSAQFSPEEIAMAVSEAGRRGIPVVAHAQGGPGLDNAVAAGVRSIEHGWRITEEQMANIAAAGCWFVPTLLVYNDVLQWAGDCLAGHGLPDVQRPWAEFVMRRHRLHPAVESVKMAKHYGVRMAMGTDCSHRSEHGTNLKEISLMREAGLTEEEALLAATSNGAELCAVAGRYGRIEPGYVFDAIVLDRDPGDLSVFRDPDTVTGVFLGGVPVKPHPRLEHGAGLARVGGEASAS